MTDQDKMIKRIEIVTVGFRCPDGSFHESTLNPEAVCSVCRKTYGEHTVAMHKECTARFYEGRAQ